VCVCVCMVGAACAYSHVCVYVCVYACVRVHVCVCVWREREVVPVVKVSACCLLEQQICYCVLHYWPTPSLVRYSTASYWVLVLSADS